MLVALALLAERAATRSIDFPVYHRAAQQILAGNYELYPPEAYGGVPHPSQGFRYAPAVAFLFLPFGWLSLETAAFVFVCLKMGALWWMGATIARRIGLTTPRHQKSEHERVPIRVGRAQGWGRAAFLVAFLIVGGYLVEELRFGNAHLFVVALMVLAFDRAESGKVATPAMALAIAIATKLTPLALLAYFALRRRWAVCMATVVVLVALVVLPALVMGVDGNARQLRAFATYAMEKVDEGDNYSLRGVFVRYLTPGLEDSSHIRANVADLPMSTVNAMWLASLAALGIASLVVLWRHDDDPVVRTLEFSIVMTGIVLASPHTQRRYYVAVYVPVVALVLLWNASARAALERRRIAAGVLATALPASILPLVFGGHRLALIYEASSPYTLGGLVLFGVLLAMTHARKGSRATASDPVVSRPVPGNRSRNLSPETGV